MVVEIEAVALCLEPKALVEQHGRVVDRDMQCDVLASTRLYEVVEHGLPNARLGEVRVHQQEGDVGLPHSDVWRHEPTAHQQLAVQSHAGGVGVVEGVRYVHWPEEVGQEGIAGRHVALLQVAEVDGAGEIGGGGVVMGGVSMCSEVAAHNVS